MKLLFRFLAALAVVVGAAADDALAAHAAAVETLGVAIGFKLVQYAALPSLSRALLQNS